MLNIDSIGSFYVRIKELPIMPEIEGKIVYIHGVDSNNISLSAVNNCNPSDDVHDLDAKYNDNGWYDISSLIFKANIAMLPKYSRCVWENESAVNYRNYMIGSFKTVNEDEAVDNLCMIGKQAGKIVNFSKQVYYVVAADNNGYMLAYAGFCKPLNDWQRPNIVLKVLRIIGTARKLYLAKPIVEACNAAYNEDLGLADNYISSIKESAKISMPSNISEIEDRTSLKQLSFGL